MNAIQKDMMKNATGLCNKVVRLLNAVPENTFYFLYGSMYVVGTHGLVRYERRGHGPFRSNQEMDANADIKGNAVLSWFHSAKFCATRYGNFSNKSFVLPLYCPSCAAFHLYFAGGFLIAEHTHVSWDKMDWHQHASMVGSASHAETHFIESGAHDFWKMLRDVSHRIVWIDQAGAPSDFPCKNPSDFPCKKHGIKRSIQQVHENTLLKKQKQVYKVFDKEHLDEEVFEKDYLNEEVLEKDDLNEEVLGEQYLDEEVFGEDHLEEMQRDKVDDVQAGLFDIAMAEEVQQMEMQVEKEEMYERFVEEDMMGEIEVCDSSIRFYSWAVVHVAPEVVEETHESFLRFNNDNETFGVSFSEDESKFVVPTIRNIPPPLSSAFSDYVPHMQNIKQYRSIEFTDDMPFLMNDAVSDFIEGAQELMTDDEQQHIQYDSELFFNATFGDDE